MASFYPIYNDDPLLNGLNKNECPSSSDMCGNTGVMVNKDSVKGIPLCTTDLFTDNLDISPNGCCVVETDKTCETYLDDNTGNFHDMGIKFLDSEGKNGRNICHSAPIRKKTIQIQDFFIIIVINALVLVITAILGACYEFWFRYGESKNCIYYKMDCLEKKLSIIEYMFPTNICQYPYQECKKSANTMKGGGFGHGYKDNPEQPNAYGVKCVTIHNDGENSATKPFPYNLVDWANTNIRGELFRMPFKAFAFYFLHSTRISRMLISLVMTFFSKKYQQIVNNNAILSNIMFLLFTGILFNVIAKITEIDALNGANGYIIYALIILINIGTIIGLFATTLVYLWFPNSFLGKTLEACDNKSASYYKLIDHIKLFWSYNKEEKDVSMGKKVLHIFLDVFLLFPLFIMMIISLCIGQLGSICSMIYMIFSLLFNIFYIPMSNSIEFLDIIKSHGNLLTILFCISIVLASAEKLNPTTTGIIGAILGILILYKILTNMK